MDAWQAYMQSMNIERAECYLSPVMFLYPDVRGFLTELKRVPCPNLLTSSVLVLISYQTFSENSSPLSLAIFF